jgi:hypothetical protein
MKKPYCYPAGRRRRLIRESNNKAQPYTVAAHINKASKAINLTKLKASPKAS